MSSLLHTYGPTCLLYDPEDNPATKPDFSSPTAPPKVRAQFFYLSSFPIDDPLTPLPAPSASSSASVTSFPPRPFSVLDNIALEEAWHGLRTTEDDSEAEDTRKSGTEEDKAIRNWKQRVDRLIIEAQTVAREYRHASKDIDLTPINERHDSVSIFSLVEQHVAEYGSSDDEAEKRRLVVSTLRNVIEQISRHEESDWRHEFRPIIMALFNATANEIPNQDRDTPKRVTDKLLRQINEQSKPASASIPIRTPAKPPDNVDASGKSGTQFFTPDQSYNNTPNSLKRHSPPGDRKSKTSKRNSTSSPSGNEVYGSYSSQTRRSIPPTGLHAGDTNISGSPFIRAPARSPRSVPSPRSPATPSKTSHPLGGMVTVNQGGDGRSSSSGLDPSSSPSRVTVKRLSPPQPEVTPIESKREPDAVIPMKPIYWSPIHDISLVIRATWFYKNTMLPVEPELANQLEAGYMYIRPWTETWQDELNSCIENGAEAEMKIVHRIWPLEEEVKAQRTVDPGRELKSPKRLSIPKPTEPERPSILYENQAAGSMTPPDAPRPYKSSSVIYVDSKEAQILRPNLLPSAARGRRPLSAIRKGRQIGIPIIRGFNAQAWDKLHPVKIPATSGRRIVKMHQTAEREYFGRRPICYACQIEDKRPTVSDLVLVVHGIGQKLSERVESYHFTHAINAFRRQVNIELNSDTVWPHMRPELESIMVLPVNWRSTLSLEDADVEPSVEDPDKNKFSLKDITPETMPAIRSLISDVMLDIPYYLSHHKQKMVQAVVKEANRIYRLWCQNNPDFRKAGKVHLIAHSLGSIMAMDILSQQPTYVPHIDFERTKISQTIFEFDTSNVFFCGSPAGFFLLLNKSTLLPRRNRGKPGTHGEDLERGVAGEAGTYGCLAVDNIYNVMHDTDPITYRLNAAVDSDLANSLKPASVPSSSTSFFQAVSSVFRWSSSKGPSQSIADLSASLSHQNQRPASIAKLPSNIEMETHDFSREELAEKRMALLNDNGQIDFYISGGGGPLSIQYLNMLTAHSSYWVLQDFVRFLVVEIGRKRGRDGTLLALRAEKKKGWKRSKA
ncbi:hypothetical protein ACJ73_01631 [Blastomyces percursus]|uniref:DDHD domain-containing protein n=1 Tax=Blastomyces percursus TaxID=1658174 RepID=A0A1J9REG8_9EURO|nr:hypothetical protein ACJ73_01631 [Blastomyces percursus]